MNVKNAPIENLVFEGGGVRGIAYAGALKALDENGVLPNIQRVAGASAGAFTALLLSLDYSPTEVREALQSIHFKTLEDKPNPVRIATHYGLYKGEVLYDWVAKQVTRMGLAEDITFEALAAKGTRELKVYATNLNTRNTREFSASLTPTTSVVGAVRASMSIPLMYAAWQFPNSIPDDDIYVDGGTVYNYPINAFDDANGNTPNTLGFCFTNTQSTTQSNTTDIDNVFEFTKSLFATIMSAQEIDFKQDPEQVLRSVQINDLGYHATDLDLSAEGFDRLFQAGYEATKLHLEANRAAATNPDKGLDSTALAG